MTIRKTFLVSMLIFIALSAAIGIVSVLAGHFGEFQTKIMLTTIALGAYSLTGLCCSSILDRPKLKMFATVGVGASILGAAFAVLTNWELISGLGVVLQGRFSFLIIAVSLAHVSLLLRIKTVHSAVIIARGCTIAAIAVVAFLLLGIVFDPDVVAASGQLLVIFGILDVTGTIATPILHAIVNNSPGS